MSYDERCGLCRNVIEPGERWVEADGCNLCASCWRVLQDGDKAAIDAITNTATDHEPA